MIDIQGNSNAINAFMTKPRVEKLLARFKTLGCTVENVTEITAPIYIALPLAGTQSTPFVGVMEAAEMVDGKMAMWVGIDDDNENNGIGWYRTEEDMARAIVNILGGEITPAIRAFCQCAYELNDIMRGVIDPERTS